MRNADWLRHHPDRSPRAWATAQGVATLPLALLGYGGFWAWAALSGLALEMPLGPRPAVFVGLMLAIGLFASWLGTLCWNEASQRLPTALVGQLIVFETLSALAYAQLLRGHWPPLLPIMFTPHTLRSKTDAWNSQSLNLEGNGTISCDHWTLGGGGPNTRDETPAAEALKFIVATPPPSVENAKPRSDTLSRSRVRLSVPAKVIS